GVDGLAPLLARGGEPLALGAGQHGGDGGVGGAPGESLVELADGRRPAVPQQVLHLGLQCAQARRIASCGHRATSSTDTDGSAQTTRPRNLTTSAIPTRTRASTASTGWNGANQVIAPE